MEKKDIYEHLAKIYLDASVSRREKNQKRNAFKNKILFFLGIVIVTGFSLLINTYLSFNRNKPQDAEVALVLCPDVVKINFHFDPAKKEMYSLGLNKLDLTKFKTLGFSVKKANFQDNISLRVEFISAFREKAEIYLKDISHKWQDYKLSLAEFKNISDWSEMLSISFIVEEWNVREKRGVVYLDNVRFLR